MLNYLFWALALNDVSPSLRLLLLYMADRGRWTGTEYEPSSSAAAAAIDVAKAADWIGCETDEIAAQLPALRALGVMPAEIVNGILRFTFPDLPGDDVRSGTTKPERTHSIYVIAASANVSKVGISRFPGQRLAGLQSANPIQELRLAYVAHGPKTKIMRAEQLAHAALSHFTIANEWFRVSADDAIEIVKAVLRELGIA